MATNDDGKSFFARYIDGGQQRPPEPEIRQSCWMENRSRSTIRQSQQRRKPKQNRKAKTYSSFRETNSFASDVDAESLQLPAWCCFPASSGSYPSGKCT